MADERTFELTPYEKMVVNACQCGDYMVMGTSFIYGNNSPIDKDIFKKALVILQKRHPFLNSYLVIKKKENQIFLKINNDDTSDRIEIEWTDLTDQKFDNLRAQINEISANFNSKMFIIENKNLLWRVQVISYLEDGQLKHVINLVIHIAITDGINITTLSIEIVNIMNALLDNSECDEMKVKLEPVEDLHTLCKKTNLFKEEFTETIRKLNSRDKVKFVLPEKFKSAKETGFKLDLFKLDKELSKKILDVSKSKSVRFTGYFHTTALYALKKLYNENGLDFPKRISIEIPISLRIRYQPNLDFAQCRLHTTMVCFPTDEEQFGDFKDFWKDALYVHKSIQENASSETGALFSMTHDENLDGFNEVFSQTNTLQEALEILSQEVLCDLAVSNLGPFVNERVKVYPGKFTIDELYCTDPLNSNPSIAPAIVIHLFFWKGQVMVELGANKASLGSCYFDRYKELLLSTIHENLN